MVGPMRNEIGAPEWEISVVLAHAVALDTSAWSRVAVHLAGAVLLLDTGLHASEALERVEDALAGMRDIYAAETDPVSRGNIERFGRMLHDGVVGVRRAARIG
jgi:hypothetical protein